MPDPASSDGLTLKGLSKRFGSFEAVTDVCLDVRRGEFLTLLGPSGSGKTSLLMMIAGFLDPSDGDIALDGQSIIRLPAEKRNFGMVFQGYALFPHMSVWQNIAYPLEVRKQPRAQIQSRVQEMLDLVQLTEFSDRLPRQLSGGQQQRVALARALSFNPQILLLDEPLGALDKKLRTDVQEQLKDLHRRVGATFIYVTHDQEEALSMSDRVVIMNHGKVVQVGAPNDLYERPETVFAANFLGKSNFLRGSVTAANGQTLSCVVAGADVHHRCNGAAPGVGELVTLALRPEKIDVAPLGDAPLSNGLQGTVSSLTYYGSNFTVTTEVAGFGSVTAEVGAWRNPHRFETGQTVDLSWQEDATVLVSEGTES
ncbi:ABC transporter ATP-binding protein [Pelagibius sp. Alg239-R121]|uniref:ABC transporter ATP-binding protein n=1 Tax=Pelagibius sp. Alg239-R121 TaxID=2993448 RepID=UPI0024A6FA51|nr:ABC transporter ATP-binding protein [Pelagibius sp. Alg239-R121]